MAWQLSLPTSGSRVYVPGIVRGTSNTTKPPDFLHFDLTNPTYQIVIGLGLRDIFLSYTDLKPDRLPTMRNVVPVAADSSVRNDYYYFN